MALPGLCHRPTSLNPYGPRSSLQSLDDHLDYVALRSSRLCSTTRRVSIRPLRRTSKLSCVLADCGRDDPWDRLGVGSAARNLYRQGRKHASPILWVGEHCASMHVHSVASCVDGALKRESGRFPFRDPSSAARVFSTLARFLVVGDDGFEPPTLRV